MLLIKCVGTVLSIQGSKEYMQILAHNVCVPALERSETGLENAVPRHTHIEWHPGDFYLDENSDPLVVTANSVIIKVTKPKSYRSKSRDERI